MLVCARRLHLRKCQCREKTPPCKNCPKCKDVSEITAMLDLDQQLAACKTQLQCDICACRCAHRALRSSSSADPTACVRRSTNLPEPVLTNLCLGDVGSWSPAGIGIGQHAATSAPTAAYAALWKQSALLEQVCA